MKNTHHCKYNTFLAMLRILNHSVYYKSNIVFLCSYNESKYVKCRNLLYIRKG